MIVAYAKGLAYRLTRRPKLIGAVDPARYPWASTLVSAIRRAPRGPVIEFGVSSGGTLLTLACEMERLGIREKVYGLDSFAGLEQIRAEDGAEAVPGRYSASERELRARLRFSGLNVELVTGLFHETLPGLLMRERRPFAVAHIDCDLAEPAEYVLNAIWPRMAKGGCVVLDDYGTGRWPGFDQVVQAFCAEHGLTPEREHPDARHLLQVV